MANEVLIDPIATETPDGKITIRDSDRSKARAIEAAGNITGDAISGYQQGKARKAVEASTESFQAIAEAKSLGGYYNEDLGGYMFPEGTDPEKSQQLITQLENVRKKAKDEFKAIALASEQGVYHGSMQTRLEIERKIRNLSSQTPGFSEEIRRTAASVLGYDPTGFAIRQILDIDKPDDSDPEETKWVKNRREKMDWIRAQAMTSGTPISEAAIEAEATRLTNIEFQNEITQSRVAAGDMNADIASTKMLTLTPMEALWGVIQRKSAEQGEGFNLSDVNILRAELTKERDRQFAALVQASTANGQYPMSSKAQDDLFNRLDRRYQEVIKELPNLTQNNFLKDNLENVTLLSQVDGWSVAPEISFYKAAFGDTIATLLVELQADVVNEGQFSLLVQKYPVLFSTGGANDPTSFLNNLSKRARAVLGGQKVDEKGVPTTTGDPVLDEQLDQVLIIEALEKAKQSGNKKAYQEFYEKIEQNSPDNALAVVASDPASFSMLSNEQRKSVGAQVNMSAYTAATDLVGMGYRLKWVPKEEYVESQVEGVWGTARQNVKRRRLNREIAGEGLFVAERDPNLESSIMTWDSDAQEALDTINNYAVPIMQDGKWRQYVSPEGNFSNVEEWASQFNTTSEIAALERKLEDASTEYQEVYESSPNLVGQKRKREAELKRLEGLVKKYTDQLTSIQDQLNGGVEGE